MAVSLPSGSTLALDVMERFARDTGIEGGARPRRYLWTDAFAVGNFLGAHRSTGEGLWFDRALALVDQVHHVLGRHRTDDGRRGWLSGLDGEEAERHPTRGGLRIGKPLPERAAGEPYDARLEWDRDGQYLHYLTQWMNALRRVAEESGSALFLGWAVELAEVAWDRFAIGGNHGPPTLAWKMSVDLTRPLVPSSGQHDALDLWLNALDLANHPLAGADDRKRLERTLAGTDAICQTAWWRTDDLLGVGGLLIAAARLHRIVEQHGVDDRGRIAELVRAARSSLETCVLHDPTQLSPSYRLAFRELGLAIGLHAVERTAVRFPEARAPFADLARHAGLAGRIEAFWSRPEARREAVWLDHADINAVMLATSLAPEGWLGEH